MTRQDALTTQTRCKLHASETGLVKGLQMTFKRLYAANSIANMEPGGSLNAAGTVCMSVRALAHQAEGGQACTRGGAIFGGIVGENSGTVEGAVVLGEVQPTLEAVRALATDANPNDMRRTAQWTNTHTLTQTLNKDWIRDHPLHALPPDAPSSTWDKLRLVSAPLKSHH